MRIELSWKDVDGQHRSFRTGCPQVAEAMMRSSSDFPQVTPDIKHSFRERYGKVLGSFEQHLYEAMQKSPLSSIETGIIGLTVRMKNNEGTQLC